MKAWCLGLAAAPLALCIAFASAGQSQDAPRFRAGVDLLPIDVTVVDGQGRPVLDLGAGDFTVFVGGTPRKVVSAEWIPMSGLREAPAETAPEGYSSNALAANGRLIVLAIDQPNIRAGEGFARSWRRSISSSTDCPRPIGWPWLPLAGDAGDSVYRRP
jgi:hypothetical protein